MSYFKLHYPLIASVVFIVIILVAHFCSITSYNWSQHTISHLGAQSYKFKWIMQLGFLLFGLAVAFGVLLNGIHFRTTPILIYGLSIALTGIFCAAPFLKGVDYNAQQANLHAIFAQLAGVAFSIAILIQLFYTENSKLKIIHLVFFLLVIGISATFGLLKNNQGIAQRILYIISLYWFSFWYQS